MVRNTMYQAKLKSNRTRKLKSSQTENSRQTSVIAIVTLTRESDSSSPRMDERRGATNHPNENNDGSIEIEIQDSLTAKSRHCHSDPRLQQQHRHQQQRHSNRHHLNAVSNLANGINRIAVNYNNCNCETNDESSYQKILTMGLDIQANTDNGGDKDIVDGVVDVLKSEECAADGGDGGSVILVNRTASGGGCVETDGVKGRKTESDDCDRSQQSSISGSWDGFASSTPGIASIAGDRCMTKGAAKVVAATSSFRSLTGMKAFSPRWTDRKLRAAGDDDSNARNHQHHSYHQIRNNNHVYQRMMTSSSEDGGCTSSTEHNAAQHRHQPYHAASVDSSSFSVIERKRSRNRGGSFSSSRSDKEATDVRQYQHPQQDYCKTPRAWSTSTKTDNNDSHDEGYLSSTAEGGYQSGGGSHSVSVGVGGYSFHHPELSFAASVKSDIATGKRDGHRAAQDPRREDNSVIVKSNILFFLFPSQFVLVQCWKISTWLKKLHPSRAIVARLLPCRITRRGWNLYPIF